MRVSILSKNGLKIVNLNRRKAIRERCLNCSCWRPQELTNCTLTDCPLYPYRTGNRTHTMYFRVTKSYPTKTKVMAIYPCNGNKLTRDTGQGGKVAIWLRKRARIHVLPSCSGTRVKMVPLPVGHLPVYNLGERWCFSLAIK